jgi:hypothetical protein
MHDDDKEGEEEMRTWRWGVLSSGAHLWFVVPSSDQGDKRTTVWRLDYPCPSYLLHVAVRWIAVWPSAHHARKDCQLWTTHKRTSQRPPGLHNSHDPVVVALCREPIGMGWQVGELSLVEEPRPLGALPMAYIAPTGAFKGEDLLRTFGRTPDMLRWMQTKLDMPFPFPKYYQVQCGYFLLHWRIARCSRLANGALPSG